MKTHNKIQDEKINAAKDYPGEAIDIADNEKVTDRLIKDRVKVENNNPRNDD